MAVSIREVAKKAGVSAGTVSRAFNHYSDISEETQKRIMQAAKELGYVPNLHAKTLSSKNIRTIAIFMSGFTDHQQVDEVSHLLLQGASSYAEELDMEFAIYTITSEQQQKKSFEQLCREHSLSGALLFGLKTTDKYYENLSKIHLPCVTVDTPISGKHMGFVGTDNVTSFQQLTDLLFEHGHRTIVFLNGRYNAVVSAQRLEGAKRSFEVHRATLLPEQILDTDFSGEKTAEVVTKYLEQNGKSAATAFLCVSDLVAVSAFHTIRRMGYRVPEDFSIVGYDGSILADCTYPQITTINQQMRGKGYAAAKLLHQMIMGNTDQKEIIYPYLIRKTDSVGFLK